MTGQNKISSLGIDNAWSGNKKYNRYSKLHQNDSKLNLRERSNSSNEDSPRKYLGSLEQLGNQHISQFINKKTEARDTIVKQGAGKLDHTYLQSNSRNAPFNSKPTSISIFPFIGSIPNKMVYMTHNSIDQKPVNFNPSGIDAFTDMKINNNTKNEMKTYKNNYIRDKAMLSNKPINLNSKLNAKK